MTLDVGAAAETRAHRRIRRIAMWAGSATIVTAVVIAGIGILPDGRFTTVGTRFESGGWSACAPDAHGAWRIAGLLDGALGGPPVEVVGIEALEAENIEVGGFVFTDGAAYGTGSLEDLEGEPHELWPVADGGFVFDPPRAVAGSDRTWQNVAVYYRQHDDSRPASATRWRVEYVDAAGLHRSTVDVPLVIGDCDS